MIAFMFFLNVHALAVCVQVVHVCDVIVFTSRS